MFLLIFSTAAKAETISGLITDSQNGNAVRQYYDGISQTDASTTVYNLTGATKAAIVDLSSDNNR